MSIAKEWVYKNKKVGNDRIAALAGKMHIPVVVAALLLNRGIEKEDDVRMFLTKSMQAMKNPLEMTDVEKAAERIIKAINSGESIVVYGDYDVDGITSTTLLYSFLKSAGANVDYYIPDRYKEGYGVNIKAVNRLIIRGAKLMITVDCGITSIGEMEFAKLQGMEVIVTDHHTCKEKLPNVYAVINPKRPDCEAGYEGLAGVGVAFKLVIATAMKMGYSAREYFDRYASLAAIGTIADVVPLLDENRVIVDRGLKLLEEKGIPGVSALIESAGSGTQKKDSSMVAFLLSPRINAAGRMLNAKLAVELLMAKTIDEARPIAEKLSEANRERQRIEQEIFAEAVEMIESDPDFDKKKVIVLAHEDWHQGVIGIVASRILEKYYKPSILISYSGDIGKGSGRSVSGFNLFDALTACEDNLIGYGGHAAAAGLNLNMADLAVFTRRINEYAAENMKPDATTPQLGIDCGLKLRDVTVKNAKMLERLEPYGMGNERPVFATANVRVTSVSKIGADEKHLRMRLTDGAVYVNAIGFRMAEMYDTIKPGDMVDAAYQIDINNYMGNEQVQMMLKDIRKH